MILLLVCTHAHNKHASHPLILLHMPTAAALITFLLVLCVLCVCLFAGDNCADDGCKDGHTGFEATKGWDPVTGLGSPNYPNMQKYIQSLGHKVMERRAAAAKKQQL